MFEDQAYGLVFEIKSKTLLLFQTFKSSGVLLLMAILMKMWNSKVSVCFTSFIEQSLLFTLVHKEHKYGKLRKIATRFSSGKLQLMLVPW